jgi:glycosyltransferase involved in cell wall biosynthesis
METRRDIPQLLKISDLFVLPSLWEGFGIVLLEAMVSGLAVIATKVDGIPEVVLDGRTGILIPPNNSGIITQHIITLLLDAKLRIEYGNNGRERVLKYFTPKSYIDKLIELYN